MDAPILPDLLNQIPSDQEIGSVTGDVAYDTRKCHDAISARNANAVIPPGLRPSRAELIHWINFKTPQTRARMRSCGSLTHPEPARETKRCYPQSIWVERCGDS